MSDKRMLVVDADVVRKIDENRGDMSRSDFLNFLIDSNLKEEPDAKLTQKYVDREEFEHFVRGIKELLRNFLDFFVSYGMELGEEPKEKTFEELTKKLQTFAAEGKARSK